MAEVKRATTLPIDAARAWTVLTSEAGAWLADDGELDVRVGGDGWFREDGRVRHAVVESLDEGRRLVLRWWPLDSTGVGAATRVALELEADPEEPAQRTRLLVTESAAAPALPPSGPVALALAR